MTLQINCIEIDMFVGQGFKNYFTIPLWWGGLSNRIFCTIWNFPEIHLKTNLPHSVKVLIWNPSWALIRPTVGSKITFNQPTTHPPPPYPIQCLNFNYSYISWEADIWQPIEYLVGDQKVSNLKILNFLDKISFWTFLTQIFLTPKMFLDPKFFSWGQNWYIQKNSFLPALFLKLLSTIFFLPDSSVWACMVLYGPLWSHMVPCGPLWSLRVP